MKKRLDILLVEQSLAPSQRKGKAYIMSGDVYGRTKRRQGRLHVFGGMQN